MGLFSRSSNVRKLRGLVWLGAIAFAAVAGFQLTELLKALKAGDFNPEPLTAFTRIVNEAESTVDETGEGVAMKVADFEVIWTSPINGYVKKEPVVVVEEKEDRPLNKKPISDVISVTSMVVDSEGGGVVYLHYKDEIPSVTLDENRLTVGSPLKHPYDGEPFNASIVKILANGVVISWCGEDEVVQPGTDVREVSNAEAAASQIAGLSAKERDVLNKYKGESEGRKVTELGSEAYLVGKDDRLLFSSDDEAWRREVRVDQQKGPDGRDEVVLRTVSKPMAQRYGVQGGDVLIAINGTPVSSRSQAVRYFNQNPDLPRYEVEIRRLGRPVIKTFYNPKE